MSNRLPRQHDFLKAFNPDSPHVAVQLGTEQGGLLKQVSKKQVIDYPDIPFYPTSTVGPQLERLVVEIVHEFPPQD